MSKIVKIRFNNQHNDTPLIWRVIIDDVEYLASEILINTPSFTSVDTLPDGAVKHHVSAAYERLIWNDDRLTVE